MQQMFSYHLSYAVMWLHSLSRLHHCVQNNLIAHQTFALSRYVSWYHPTIAKMQILTSHSINSFLFKGSWGMIAFFPENNGVLCDFPANPSVLHVADLIGLCADRVERNCSVGLKQKQRGYYVSPDNTNLAVQYTYCSVL